MLGAQRRVGEKLNAESAAKAAQEFGRLEEVLNLHRENSMPVLLAAEYGEYLS